MSDSGQRPGRKSLDKAGKKDARNGRDRKRRNPLGNPLLWAAPIILVVLLAGSLMWSMGGYRSIDTSDGLTLLKDKPETIKSVTVVDGTQRVELDLTEPYVQQPKEEGESEETLGEKVQFTFTDAQAEQVDRLVQAANPSAGYNSVVPTTSWWSSLLQLLLPVVIFLGFMWWIFSRMSGGRGGAMGFGKYRVSP